MVTLQILVLSFLVRARVPQQKANLNRLAFFCLFRLSGNLLGEFGDQWIFSEGMSVCRFKVQGSKFQQCLRRPEPLTVILNLMRLIFANPDPKKNNGQRFGVAHCSVLFFSWCFFGRFFFCLFFRLVITLVVDGLDLVVNSLDIIFQLVNLPAYFVNEAVAFLT